MRFKKGDKVEVLSNKVAALGSWRCAEIIWGNGHNYIVRFNTFMRSADHALFETVSRKAIRPLPPLLVSNDLVPQDSVEVYDGISWKIATVVNVLERNYFKVRPVGSTLELRVHESKIRARQSWKNKKWVVVGKGSKNVKDGKSDKILILKYNRNSNTKLMNIQVKNSVQNDCLQHNNIPESQDISCRTLKRGSPYDPSQLEAYTRSDQKYRTVEKDGMRYKAAASVYISSSLEQEDAIAYPREILDKKYKYTSNNRLSGFTCSVGSCSATSSRYYKTPFSIPAKDSNEHLSDAESIWPVYHGEGNNIFTTEEESRAEVHKLELHAYCCTVKALHVAGPLSWEQEVVLTDLRVSLNISDEEHLMEGQIRKLVDLALKVAKVAAELLVLFCGDVCDIPLVILIQVAAACLHSGIL